MAKQVAYLMADISDVRAGDIKEISDSLEMQSCRLPADNSTL